MNDAVFTGIKRVWRAFANLVKAFVWSYNKFIELMAIWLKEIFK